MVTSPAPYLTISISVSTGRDAVVLEGMVMVQVPEELLGKRVILNPEESRLTPGCPVKEAPKQ